MVYQKRSPIIEYTDEQIDSIVIALSECPIYSGYIMSMFFKSTHTETNYTVLQRKSREVYDKMTSFPRTKYTHNFPDKKSRRVMRDFKMVMFIVTIEDLPMYIGNPITGPIAAWRMKNGI